MKSLRMPRGYYRNKKLEELPSPYLKWIAENWSEDNPYDASICEEADKIWQEREKFNTHHYYDDDKYQHKQTKGEN